MLDAKYIFGTIGVSVLILSAAVLGARMTDTSDALSQPADAHAVVSESTHDWGTIGIQDGMVEARFSIANEGSDVLNLANVKTSCSCTTAELVRVDQRSPKFGMHSSSSYVMEVPSGETAELIVTFDPLFHGPQGTGTITREVVVETNDPENKSLQFRLSADVVEEVTESE